MSGLRGTVCLPCQKHIKKPKKGWVLMQCQKCGQPCWMSPSAAKTIVEWKYDALCMECAIND